MWKLYVSLYVRHAAGAARENVGSASDGTGSIVRH